MHKQFMKLRSELMAAFPERKDVIDGSLAAVLAREHVVLIGPPGTGKSLLVRTLSGALGAVYFERLLTRFSTPEELYGPVSLKALDQDRFTRITVGKLPEAEIAFIDEIWKCNSALLNSLLAICNERVFHNDGAPTQCPLVTMFAASNEMPDGKDLEALWDRFLLHYDVQYLLVASNLRGILVGADPVITTKITMDQLRVAQGDVSAVQITDETVDALLTIRDACRAEGIIASDRRWRKCLGLVRASAWLSGERTTSPEDLSLLSDALWREPREKAKVKRLVGNLCDPASSAAVEIIDAAREIAAKVAAMGTTDRKAFVGQAAQAIDQFGQQQTKLQELAKGAGRRARATISDAVAEIQGLHAEMARTVGHGLGLRSLR